VGETKTIRRLGRRKEGNGTANKGGRDERENREKKGRNQFRYERIKVATKRESSRFVSLENRGVTRKKKRGKGREKRKGPPYFNFKKEGTGSLEVQIQTLARGHELGKKRMLGKPRDVSAKLVGLHAKCRWNVFSGLVFLGKRQNRWHRK